MIPSALMLSIDLIFLIYTAFIGWGHQPVSQQGFIIICTFNIILIMAHIILTLTSLNNDMCFSIKNRKILLGWVSLIFTLLSIFATDPDSTLNKLEFGDNNASFTNHESWGHYALGLLSLFIFNLIQGYISTLNVKVIYIHLFVLLTFGSLVLYPIYNLIKRSICCYDEFYDSSFSNNLMEWCLGFYSGLHIAACIEPGISDYYVKLNADNKKFRIFTIYDTIFGILLIITSLIASIFYYLSGSNIIVIFPPILTVATLVVYSIIKLVKFCIRKRKEIRDNFSNFDLNMVFVNPLYEEL